MNALFNWFKTNDIPAEEEQQTVSEGGLNNLHVGGNAEEHAEEDPELVAARQEAEERRREKHRGMEREREKIRTYIREKYNIVKKDEGEEVKGRIGGNKKTPEQVAQEHIAAQQAAQNGLLAQLGVGEVVEKSRVFVNNAVEAAKVLWPFGGK